MTFMRAPKGTSFALNRLVCALTWCIEMKVSPFEMIFIRFLHLLAHHLDFAIDEEQIIGMAK